ncbi:transposase [Streptomyces chartreusis]
MRSFDGLLEVRVVVHGRRAEVWGTQPTQVFTPPHSSVHAVFARWERAQYVDDLHDTLRDRLRHTAGRDVEPTAAVVDSQSLRAAETVAAGSRGWDAGKKLNGRKRDIAVDTLSLLLVVLVTAACVQDRDGARPLISRQVRTVSTCRPVCRAMRALERPLAA